MPPNEPPAPKLAPENDPQLSKGELKPLQEKLERALEKFIPPQNLRRARLVVRQVVREEEEHYSGPIPHPQHLQQFESTLPGAADRILKMAEKEQDHRHSWEIRDLQAADFTERLGLFCGTLIAAGLVAGAVACAYLGATVIGAALVAASAASIVPAIVKGRSWLRSQKSEKPRENLPAVPTKKQPAKKGAR